MKTLIIDPEKKSATGEKDPSDSGEADLCLRVGSLVVHSLGVIEGNCDGYHSENYITPPGYVATRIGWSSTRPRSRTVYVLKIDRSADDDGPVFTILPGDSPSSKITGSNVAQVYTTLLDRVKKVNGKLFSQGDPLSKLPVVRRTRRKTFGLNGPQVSCAFPSDYRPRGPLFKLQAPYRERSCRCSSLGSVWITYVGCSRRVQAWKLSWRR